MGGCGGHQGVLFLLFLGGMTSGIWYLIVLTWSQLDGNRGGGISKLFALALILPTAFVAVLFSLAFLVISISALVSVFDWVLR